MRFSVRHEMRYRYSAPVRLAAHVLRLTPRAQGIDDLTHSLRIEPEPLRLETRLDSFGNPVTEVEFDAETDRLTIESRFSLQTLTPAPLVTALPPLPWTAGDPGDWLGTAAIDPVVQSFAQGIAAEAGQAPERFLDLLNRRLFERTDRHIRMTGAARSASETLASASGACRDLTVLFMACCHHLGLPARFVSGYQAWADTPDGRRHLHAWPEVHLPGLGWRGYDPTHGMTVTEGHVALCAAPDQAGTMPLQGGYFGTGVRSEMDYAVEIEADPAAPSEG